MGTWDHHPSGDFRNEGWGVTGSGISRLWEAWNNTDNTKYCTNPATEGAACVSFPVDITDIPDGAEIESITIMLRVAKMDSQARSVTVNVLCSDDVSKWTTTTIWPSTTIEEREIVTLKWDALNKVWDRNRLNKILCQVFSRTLVVGCIRIYRMYVRINYRTRPTITVDAPSGTVTTPSPTISWTYVQENGDRQKSAEYKIFTADQQETIQFNPDLTTPVYTGSVTGDLTSAVLPVALTPDEYYVYVRARSVRGPKSVWTGRAFTVAGAAPGVPGGGVGGGGSIGTGAGAGFVSVVPDNAQSSAFITMRDGSNLLSIQSANFENTTDYMGYTTSNCSVARDSSQSFNGTGAMKMTATASGTMQADSTFQELAGSTPVTARAQLRAAVTARTINLRILFYDAAFTLLAGTITATPITDAAGSWTEISATGTSPSGAAYAKVQVEVASAAAGESHYVDTVGLMYGSNSVWSHGGHASRNLLSMVASTADDPLVGSEPWATANVATAYVRATTAGIGSHGVNAFRLTYNGISPTIAFVSAGTVYSDTTTSSGYTLNKPAGVADGHLLVAYVAANEHSTITPPTGWTLVNTASLNNGSSDVCLHVLKRDGLAADPSTWVGNLSTTATRRRAIVVAYSGAAAAALQFAENRVATSSTGSTAVTTGTINLTAANAYRLSAFATRDDASGSTLVANTQPPSPPIAFVNAATPWSSSSGVSTYTINRPSGVVSADLMVAQVLVRGNITTISPPSGWTLVRRIFQDDSVAPSTMAILKRTAGASESASWSGTLSSTAPGEIVTQCVAYRNADTAANQFIAENSSSSPSGTSITSATVSNTDSGAWRLCMFGATSIGTSFSWSSSESSKRADYGKVEYASYRATVASVFDSGSKVSTGSHYRTGTLSTSYYSAVSWIGVIKPLPTPPSPPPNETERTDGVTGASDPWVNLAVYDSGGVASPGSQSVTAVVTPGSGTSIVGSASWIGVLIPASPTVIGEVGANLTSYIDISSVNPKVLELTGSMVTFSASFLGSVAGTPYLSVLFYNGNELINTYTDVGTSFNSTTWVKSSVTFAIPSGTTRMKLAISVRDRAVSDIVYFDRASLSFGSSNVYRPGTGGDAHPIFSIPVIEYIDDDGTGYSGKSWSVLPGTVSNPPVYDQLTGLATFRDQTVVPLWYRKYRAKTISFGLLGDTFESAYGQDSPEVVVNATEWWLKDPKDSSKSMQLKVEWNDLEVGTTGTSSVFQPLGADLPNVVTEGYKGDRVEITVIVTRTEFAELRQLLSSGRTLYLQSNMDHAWWVRPVGDLGATTKMTSKRMTDPLRWVKLSFVQVAPEL